MLHVTSRQDLVWDWKHRVLFVRSIKGSPPGPVDGLFGPLTYSSVRLFQKQQGLIENGQVDSTTLNELIKSLVLNYFLLEKAIPIV